LPLSPWSIATAVLLGAVLLGTSRLLRRAAAVGAGYKAKVLASAVFVSGRDPVAVLASDVQADSYFILRFFRTELDAHARRVTVSLFGISPRTAVYRPGLGVALVPTGELPEPKEGPAPEEPPGGGTWPVSHAGPVPEALTRVVESAFAEPSPRKARRTRALLILRDGERLAEKYAPGFGPDMPLCGWSMSKSVLGALVGVAVGEGWLRLEDRRLLEEWSGPGDPRADISLEDLLRMRSGLMFREVYADPLSDVTQMLFALPDAAGHASSRPLRHPPGHFWKYSSGTTNVVSRVLRRALERKGEDYHRFPGKALFGPLGMRSAVFETDARGTFVGSSFLYATARDWARVGQLFLQDGVWEGRRVLPEGWVRFSTTPTSQSPNGCYGAHWWLKLARELGGETEAARCLPPDAFHALGHEGQTLTVIPSRRLVVVRLGLSVRIEAWNHAAFLADLLAAL